MLKRLTRRSLILLAALTTEATISFADESKNSLILANPQSRVRSVDVSRCPNCSNLAKVVINLTDEKFDKIQTLIGSKNHSKSKIDVVFLANPPTMRGANTGTTIYLNGPWFVKHPGDLGCLTFQLTEVIEDISQQSAERMNAQWLRVAIADFVRLKLGPQSPGWFARCNPGATPQTSSSCGAAFLDFLEQKYPQKQIVRKILRALSEGKYSEDAWMQLTNKSLDKLWLDFTTAHRSAFDNESVNFGQNLLLKMSEPAKRTKSAHQEIQH